MTSGLYGNARNTAIPAMFASLMVSSFTIAGDVDANERVDASLYVDAPSSAYAQMEWVNQNQFNIPSDAVLLVNNFLAKRPDVNRALLETLFALRKWFGSAPEFVLDIVIDYEDAHETSLVVQVIDEQSEFEELYEKYSNFEQEWWLDNMYKSRGLFDVSLA